MKDSKNARSLWPFSIIGFFVLAVIFLVIFIVWAARQREDLVSDNYYDTEIAYQQQLDRLNRSQQFEQLPIVTYDPEKRDILVRLPNAAAQPVIGRIYLYRPSDARLDRELPLAPDTNGAQRLDARGLPVGLWKVRVQWTVAGKEYYCDRPIKIAA
jgi:hypothetical protein